MKNFLFLLAFGLVLICNAQKGYETGVIIDSIPVGNTSSETFALYLPTTYKSNLLSSILIVFSPSGRGKNALEVFKQSAEDHNYILVCSNNSRNGAYDRNFAIAERLFGHIFSNFNIKEKGVYLAGFSGGSRFVSAIASMSGQIEGVIACGAGFSQLPYHMPAAQKFAYAGICGEHDMNYREMLDAKTYLTQLGFQNTLFSFNGNHRWPPQEQIAQAFSWLEIQSVKNGSLKKSKSEILENYKEQYAISKSINETEQPLIAYERYERLAESYKNFFELDSIVDTMRAIQKSTAYLNELAAREDAFKIERDLTKTFLTRFNKDYEKAGNANMKWWEKEFQKLDKLVAKKGGSQIKKMHYRFRFNLWVIIFEKQDLPDFEPTPEQKAFCQQLYDLIYPEQAK